MNNRIFITGDKHGDFSFLEQFCKKANTSKNDILIILGDAGLNYYVSNYCDETDKNIKYKLSKGAKTNLKKINDFPITLLCIQGNHEARPELIKNYKNKKWNNGIVFYYKDVPNILFATNGEKYIINKKEYFVIGGAYSVDKYYRLQTNNNWFPEEQLFPTEKEKIEKIIEKNNKTDIVLSHTCPYKYIPRELFLSQIDQSTVDNSMEFWLDTIEEKLNYQKWYFGHYHGEKIIDKMEMLFHNIKKII